MNVKGCDKTHDCVKEIVKRRFKLFCISVRCMGSRFMDIVVYHNNTRVVGMLHYGISKRHEQLWSCFSSKARADVTFGFCVGLVGRSIPSFFSIKMDSDGWVD